jgi:hypothetical protein
LTDLTYTGFQEFLLQYAYFVYTRGHQNVHSALVPQEIYAYDVISRLFGVMKKAAAKKNNKELQVIFKTTGQDEYL